VQILGRGGDGRRRVRRDVESDDRRALPEREKEGAQGGSAKTEGEGAEGTGGKRPSLTRKWQEQIQNAPLPQAKDRWLQLRSPTMPARNPRNTTSGQVISSSSPRTRKLLSFCATTNKQVRQKSTSLQPQQLSNRKGENKNRGFGT